MVGQGRPTYKPIPVSEATDRDLMKSFRLEFEPNISGSGNKGSFKHTFMVAGQLLGLVVVCDVVQVDMMWQSDVLLQATSNRSKVDLLISHYRVRAVYTNVMTKAIILKKWLNTPDYTLERVWTSSYLNLNVRR